MSVAEAVQTRREADLEHQLEAARAQNTTLANRVRDLEQSRITEREAALFRYRLADLTRRNGAAYGATQRFDAFTDPGRVAVFLADLRTTLGSSRDEAPEQRQP